MINFRGDQSSSMFYVIFILLEIDTKGCNDDCAAAKHIRRREMQFYRSHSIPGPWTESRTPIAKMVSHSPRIGNICAMVEI